MTHKRKLIRKYVEAKIKGLENIGSNVFPSRVYPMDTASLPGACIYTLKESATRETIGSTGLHRNLIIKIDVYAKGESLDDLFDDIAEDIEAALSDISFGKLAINSMLSETEIDFNGEGETPYGLLSLSYEALYITT